MRRILLIYLSLVLALVSWSAVGADSDFYVIPVKPEVAPAPVGPPAPIPSTGQIQTYATGDDGDKRKGVTMPGIVKRFTRNGNGTFTDGLTGLVWRTVPKEGGVVVNWNAALAIANALRGDGNFIPFPKPAGWLHDGSKPGDWRLPNVRELNSLIHYGRHWPALACGFGPGDAVGVLEVAVPEYEQNYRGGGHFWTSTRISFADTLRPGDGAYRIEMGHGEVVQEDPARRNFVWCVRDPR